VNNNRRDFIKKSVLAGLFGIFAPIATLGNGGLRPSQNRPAVIYAGPPKPEWWTKIRLNDKTIEFFYDGVEVYTGQVVHVKSDKPNEDGYYTVIECKKAA
jgi:hypothetical protein